MGDVKYFILGSRDKVSAGEGRRADAQLAGRALPTSITKGTFCFLVLDLTMLDVLPASRFAFDPPE